VTEWLWFLGAFAVVLGATFVPLIGANILAPGAALLATIGGLITALLISPERRSLRDAIG
jgi:hypothetical protein